VSVLVNPILGKNARETRWGWFAYKIGRGGLSIGKTYLLRVEYPEDKPRFAPIEIQIGQNYIDVGWKNGVSPSNIYDNWPLSGGGQFYDVIIPLGRETTATGGTGDGDATKGFWVYFMDKRKPGFYWSSYSGGPAVATIRLYEIDPITNAPVVNLPAGLPTRVMTFDWERYPTQLPSDIVSYAKLMGYSAVSPIAGMKWNFQNWGDPLAGYDAVNVDDQHYWSTSKYVARSGTPPPMPLPSKPSVHAQYLAATAAAGVDYIPRFEYGGSVDLPVSAQSIGADGKIAKPNRFATYGANLLNRSTYLELKAFFDSFVAPYAASNPQFKGVFWRLRSDRMQISYGAADATLFSNDTGTPLPAGFGTMTAAQVATWCSVTIAAPYTDWWHGKRRDFHQSLITLLKSYRSDLTLVYYNWDIDKFSLKEPDLNSSSFYYQVTTLGGPTAYANDLSARQGYVASDYTSAFYNGDFSGGARTVVRPETNNLWPDYGIRPSLYSSISGIQILAPVNCNCYASFPDYINYFQTREGLGVSHCVSYDEIGAREPNPKYEGNMITPGGGPFSMAMELLAYYHGDARFLTYTVYTYGRGFADSHRRFAQAFRALPAISGALITGTPTDTAVRVYSGGGNVSYIGIAYKGYSPQSLTILIPGSWQPDYIITDLVLGTSSTVTLAGANLQINLTSGPMELNSFKVSPPPPVNITPPVQRQHL
jgi:hypothetical protein